MPLVSVIIPVYKTEQYLPRCIDSLLSQTLQDLEVILVDDGSPDNCGKICDDYAAAHPQVHVIHKENGGPQLARIAGMQAARGKYLAFLDSDDYVLPDMFGPMVEQAELHAADMVAVGFVRDFGNRLEPYTNAVPSGVYRGKELTWLWDHAIFNTDIMSQALAPCVWNKLFLRDSMLPILLSCNDKLSFGEDALHTFAALFASKCVVIMNEHQQYCYQLREGSTTNSYYKNYISDLYQVYDKLTELAQPIQTGKLTAAIAYNYIFLYQGGIAQLLGSCNPDGLWKKYRKLREISKDNRLVQCLQHVDLSHYDANTVKDLQFLAAKRSECYLIRYALKRLLKKKT